MIRPLVLVDLPRRSDRSAERAVVDQHVDSTEAVDQLRCRTRVTEVRHVRFDVHAPGPQLGFRGVERLLAATGDDELMSLHAKGLAERPAEFPGAARDQDPHYPASFNSRRRILPDTDFGISSTNSTWRTFLKGATSAATNAISSSAVTSP